MLKYISQINTFYQFISCFCVSLNFGISPFSRLLWTLTNFFWKLLWSIFVQTLRFLPYFHTLNMKINLFPVLIPTRTNCVRPLWSSTKQPTTSPTCRTPCHSLNQTPGAGLSPGTTKTSNVPWVSRNPISHLKPDPLYTSETTLCHVQEWLNCSVINIFHHKRKV